MPSVVKMLLRIAVLLFIISYVASRDPIPHAGCNVIWTVDQDCQSVQQKIGDQMVIWSTDDCGDPPDNMKCMYDLKGTYGPVTKGTHTTWDFGYIDDIDFVFTDVESGCSINGRSRSQVESIYDYSVNYCNIYNLMEGAGLTMDPGYTETTQDEICTVYSQANCTYYF